MDATTTTTITATAKIDKVTFGWGATFVKGDEMGSYSLDFFGTVGDKKVKCQYDIREREIEEAMLLENMMDPRADALKKVIDKMLVKTAAAMGIPKDEIKWDEIEFNIGELNKFPL